MTPQRLSPVDGLVQLTFAVQSILNRVATEHDLSITQVRLLGILRDRELGMMQLAQHLGLDKSSVTGLINRAQRRGFVRRAESPEDGRAVRVTITAEGLALVAEAARDVERQVTGLLATLPSAERKSFTASASKLVAAITFV
jgi:DNA-binding MarR family transcriptional regulator